MSATAGRPRGAVMAATVALVAAIAAGTGCAPAISDTGFSGRWQRGAGHETAEVSIWEDAAGWHFCWSAAGVDNGPQFACTDDGTTVMTEGGQVTYRYDARMSPGPGEREATVEIFGEGVLAGLTAIHWTDRLELQSDGLAIRSWKIGLNGRVLDPPRGPLRLAKIANEPR